MQPVGGVTPAQGLAAGCGCPNVFADEVRYPAGNHLLASCQPMYGGQLPGYQSVYDPLATVSHTPAMVPVQTSMPPAMMTSNGAVPAPQEPAAMEVASVASPAPLQEPGQAAANGANGPSQVDAPGASVGRRGYAYRRLHYGAQVGRQQQITTDQLAAIARARQNALRLRQPQRQGFFNRYLGGGRNAASVQVGPLSVPTTVQDGKDIVSDITSLFTGNSNNNQQAVVSTGAQVTAAQATPWILLVLAAIAAIGGIIYWNRRSLRRKAADVIQEVRDLPANVQAAIAPDAPPMNSVASGSAMRGGRRPRHRFNY